MYDILYFGKMADESKKVSEPKRPSKQTLFPILGSNSGPGRVSGSLLLPCASFKVEEHTADFEKGKREFQTLSLLYYNVHQILDRPRNKAYRSVFVAESVRMYRTTISDWMFVCMFLMKHTNKQPTEATPKSLSGRVFS